MPGFTRRATAAVLVGACTACTHAPPRRLPPPLPIPALDAVTADYARLAMAMNRLDPGYVASCDAPAAICSTKGAPRFSVPEIIRRAQADIRILDRVPDTTVQAAAHARVLRNQLASMTAHGRMLQGWNPDFDDEVRAVYDIEPPKVDTTAIKATLRALDTLLPPSANAPTTLTQRYRYWRRFNRVPTPRVTAVLTAALAAARRRAAMLFPNRAAVRIRVVSLPGRARGADYRHITIADGSVQLQLHPDQPRTVYDILELASEAAVPVPRRPGQIVRVPASPQGLIDAGIALTRADWLFPPRLRHRLEQRLFVLSGLNPEHAVDGDRILRLKARLSSAAVEAADAWLDGRITAGEARSRLERYLLIAPKPARAWLHQLRVLRSAFVRTFYGPILVRNWLRYGGGGAAGWLQLAVGWHTPQVLQRK